MDLEVGPDGDLYYADLDGGTIQRIRSLVEQPARPTANASATPTSGAAPLAVNFDGTGSTDPDDDTLSYAWDLDGDGAFDDSTAAQPSFTYTADGHLHGPAAGDRPGRPRRHRLGDDHRRARRRRATIDDAGRGHHAGRVGDDIAFSGSATRAAGGSVPASGLSWTLILHHCSALVPTNCHEHQIQTFSGALGHASTTRPTTSTRPTSRSS